MRVLQVSKYDLKGGAATIARSLHDHIRLTGHDSRFAVGQKMSRDPDVLEIPNLEFRNAWARKFYQVHDRLVDRNARVLPRLAIWVGKLSEPRRWLDSLTGHEDFHFPGTSSLMDLPPQKPDIVHLHNLHNAYFDLSFMPILSRQIPTVVTLHDEWTYTGHCAYTMGLENWKTGCIHCPDLGVYPSIARDSTSRNWLRKRGIYAKSQLFVATPSQWLMSRARQSIVAAAALEWRVIPNGVDTAVFRPGDRLQARKELGLPSDTLILLFVADLTRSNPFKDFELLETTLHRLAQQPLSKDLLLVCVGEEARSARVGSAQIKFMAPLMDRRIVANYFRAANLYVHAAKAEAWGLTITEASACGIPTIATAVGGIPEQIEDGRTGYLVAPGNPEEMEARVIELLANENLAKEMGMQAREQAERKFSLEGMAGEYLNWYQEILERSNDLRDDPGFAQAEPQINTN